MPVFAIWIEEDIIPRDVEVPGIDFKSEALAGAAPPLLGRRSIHTVEHSAEVRKLLVDVRSAQNDADYLSGVERVPGEGRYLTDGLSQTLGRDASQPSNRKRDSDARYLQQRLMNACGKGAIEKRACAHLTSPVFADGHLWALAFAKRLLNTGAD